MSDEYFEKAIVHLNAALLLNMKKRGEMANDTIDTQEYLGDVYVALKKSNVFSVLRGPAWSPHFTCCCVLPSHVSQTVCAFWNKIVINMLLSPGCEML